MTDHIQERAEQAEARVKELEREIATSPWHSWAETECDIPSCGCHTAGPKNRPRIMAKGTVGLIAAAQSRILALEGALRGVLDDGGRELHRGYLSGVPHDTDCPGCAAEALLAPQPQASGGDSEKCGESAGHLIAGASYFPCGLLKGHEGEHRGSGTCVTHGPYISLQPGMPKCPQWPICIPASGGEEKAK